MHGTEGDRYGLQPLVRAPSSHPLASLSSTPFVFCFFLFPFRPFFHLTETFDLHLSHQTFPRISGSEWPGCGLYFIDHWLVDSLVDRDRSIRNSVSSASHCPNRCIRYCCFTSRWCNLRSIDHYSSIIYLLDV